MASILGFFRDPAPGAEHIYGVDPLYDKVGIQKRKLLEKNPLADISEARYEPLPREDEGTGAALRESWGLGGEDVFIPEGPSSYSPSQEALSGKFTVPTDPSTLRDPRQVDPMRERVLAAIAKKIEEQRSGEEKKAADEKSLEDLVARGMKASEQRQFLGDSTPLYEDYDKGIAVGGDPNKSAADILLNIRAQARAKGRGGSLRGGKPTPEDFAASTSPTGGGMTYVQDSPELRQREEDLKEWLAGGALRDAEYAMSPEMSRRDPAGANRAADVLTGLQREKTIRDEQRRRDEATEMLSGIAGRSGKIPADEAMKIAAQNPSLAPLIQGMVGRTREQVGSRIRSDMSAAQEMALQGMSDPTNPAAALLMEAANKMQPMLASFEARLNKGEDPEAVWEDYERAKIALTNALMQDKRYSALVPPTIEPGGAPQAGQ
jgi:hypothetical protein